jgi:hypothetical protein
MSGNVFSVSPQVPAEITGVYPIVVTKSGLAYEIAYGTGVSGTVTRRQWFSAVAISYNMNTLFAAVAADMNDPATIQFYAGYGVTTGDALSNLTQTTFGLSATQLAALYTLAATQEP